MSTTNVLNVLAAQTQAVEAEAFQSQLMQGLCSALRRTPAPPCLLRAPTGSGKTFMISKVLETLSQEQPTLWLWFVPFVNLVAQTQDALAAHCPGLSPVMLSMGRNQSAQAGQVWLSTAAAVARAKDRKAGYNLDADDAQNSLAETLARARAQGLRVGLVVDEAHIGLDSTTEFGQLAAWLKADYLLLATATPDDQRLLQFLAQAGYSGLESFAVSRHAVVEARLNKRYIEAVIYELRDSMQGLADLHRLVLSQAWKRQVALKKQLQAAGIPLVPLLLVQVGNGDKTVEEAEKVLLQDCKVPPAAIGKHSAAEPDPVLMAAIAYDRSKEVLIFKQSAGTGFDAPRAFVLASTKPVNDPDFAMQFMGRIMRVTPALRRAFAKPKTIPAELDTAYVYLADARAQQGFEQAVARNAAVQSQLEGQSEKLHVRKTQSGALSYTNRETDQPELDNALPLPLSEPSPPPAAAALDWRGQGSQGSQGSLFGFAAVETAPLPEPDRIIRPTQAPETTSPALKADYLKTLENKGIAHYRLKPALPNLPAALKRETRPQLDGMEAVSVAAATQLPLPENLRDTARRVALNRLRDKEIRTELTEKNTSEREVEIFTDRNALAQRARQTLRDMGCEEADMGAIIDTLTARLQSTIDAAWEALDEDQRPDERTRIRQARDAAHWVVCKQQEALNARIQNLIATQCQLEEAAALPHALLFPRGAPLSASAKNIYGVLPPSSHDLQRAESLLYGDLAPWFKSHSHACSDGLISLDRFDHTWALNEDEHRFAKALDRASFVAWWHRNPQQKPYGVRVLRADSRHYFWPDFVVCLHHLPQQPPLPRLIETKHDTKDAAHKAERTPLYYGKVLFLTRDKGRLHLIKDDGALGASVDEDDLHTLHETLRDTVPLAAGL
jgi:superfamily II DNA or RNA helicase